MGRQFTASSSQSLLATSAVVSGFPVTIACWAYPTDDTIVCTLIGVGSSTTNHNAVLDIAGTVANNPFRCGCRGNITAGSSNIDNPSFNTWSHFCGVFASTTSRTAYLNGTAGTTNTTDVGTPSWDRTGIGATYRSDFSPAVNYMSGYICEAAIWNVALGATEISLLAAGMNPLRSASRANLVQYWLNAALVGQASPEPSLVASGGVSLSLVNAPSVDATFPATMGGLPSVFTPGIAFAA